MQTHDLALNQYITHDLNGEFKCSACEKKFKKKFSIQRHIRVVHLNLRPLLCHCGKTFATKEQMTRHETAKHTHNKPFNCEKGCTRAFASPNARIYHHRVHHEDGRFRCPQVGCTRDFSSQKHLKSHMLRPHEACLRPETMKRAEETCQRQVEELKLHNSQLAEMLESTEYVSFEDIEEDPDDLFDVTYN